MANELKNPPSTSPEQAGWSEAVLEAVRAAQSRHLEGHKENPATPRSPWQRFTDRIKSSWKHAGELIRGISDNVDPLNLFARIKDSYYIARAGETSLTAFFAKGLSEKSGESTDNSEIQRRAKQRSTMLTDGVNGSINVGISAISNKAESDSVLRVYGGAVKKELGLERDVTYDDLLKSKNPMVARAASYYKSKGSLRVLSDLPFFGGTIVGAIDEANDGKLLKNADPWVVDIAKSSAYWGLLAKTVYHAWYFVFRFAGSFYRARELWHATAAAEDPEFQNKFADRKVFEFASGKDVFEMQRWFADEEGHTSFSPKDPISKRIADRAAEYLNWSHLRTMVITDVLEKDKEGGVAKGKALEQDMDGVSFKHEDLVNFIGFGGFQINEVRKSALRLEVFAHKGYDEFQRANALLHQIQRPRVDDYISPESYGSALSRYENAVDMIGKELLGSKWPPAWFDKQVQNLQAFGFPEFEAPVLEKSPGIAEKIASKAEKSARSFAESVEKHAKPNSIDSTPQGIRQQPRTGMTLVPGEAP